MQKIRLGTAVAAGGVLLLGATPFCIPYPRVITKPPEVCRSFPNSVQCLRGSDLSGFIVCGNAIFDFTHFETTQVPLSRPAYLASLTKLEGNR